MTISIATLRSRMESYTSGERDSARSSAHQSRQAEVQHEASREVSTLYLNQAGTASANRSYDSINVAGTSKAIFGDVHGDVHYHVRPPHAIIGLSGKLVPEQYSLPYLSCLALF